MGERELTYHYLCIIYFQMHPIPRMYLQFPNHYYRSHKDFLQSGRKFELPDTLPGQVKHGCTTIFCQLYVLYMSFNNLFSGTISCFILLLIFYLKETQNNNEQNLAQHCNIPFGENVLDKLNSGMSYDDVPHYLNLNESTKKLIQKNEEKMCFVLQEFSNNCQHHICSINQNHEKLLNVLFQRVSHQKQKSQ